MNISDSFTGTLNFAIKGNPIAKKRHRTTTKNSKFPRNYNPSKKDEELFLGKVKKEIGVVKLTGPIIIKSFFFFKRPKTHFGTGRNENILKKKAPEYHIVKPDIDNLEKFLYDSLNGALWGDDSQIYKSESVKRYHNVNGEGHVFVTVYFQNQNKGG